MEWVPVATLKQGGPWAVLLGVLVTLFLAWKRGEIVLGTDVDRWLTSYRDTITDKDRHIAYLQTANEKKDQIIQTLSEQNAKLTAYAALGTHALEGLLKEARSRETSS